MREIIEDIFIHQPLDPGESAKRNMRPTLRKRFYDKVDVKQKDGLFNIALDDRPVRTPARRLFAFPSRALAQEAAAEWQAQVKVVDPASMPLTRLANSIIDGVADQIAPVTDEIVRYLGSDLLLYRANSPAGLVQMQNQHWDPALDWARNKLGARFVLVEGVVHQAQPGEALAAASTAIPKNIWRLGAVNATTTLTGSALLALALAHDVLTPEQIWAAAHVDENWNEQKWGMDADAVARRAYREAEMRAAAKVLRHVSEAECG